MRLAWRYFPTRDVDAALAWADRPGHAALHHTGFPYRRWRFTCHLWACDEPTLLAAARRLTVAVKWIQRAPPSSRMHFDVFGLPLIVGLRLVDNPVVMLTDGAPNDDAGAPRLL